MANLTFHLRGTLGVERLREVKRKLAAVGSGLGPIMRRIGLFLLDLQKLRFDKARGAERSGVTFGNVRWVGLTSKYQAAKQKKGFENWLMVRSRALMSSLTLHGARDNIFRQSQNWVEVGSRNHVLGYRWLMKKRPIIFMSDEDRRGITGAFAEEIRGLWSGSLARVRAAYAARKANQAARGAK